MERDSPSLYHTITGAYSFKTRASVSGEPTPTGVGGGVVRHKARRARPELETPSSSALPHKHTKDRGPKQQRVPAREREEADQQPHGSGYHDSTAAAPL